MPLLYKPRNPTYGIKKSVKRGVVRRKPMHASVLPETKEYIESKNGIMSPGQVIDAVVKLYAENREVSEVSVKEREFEKLEALNTTVSQETISYINFMREVMTPGELIDIATRLYRKLTEQI